MTFAIRRLDTVDEGDLDGLAALLVDCVEGGASVSFLSPLTHERARGFWAGIADGVAHGSHALLVAVDDDGLCGSVTLATDMPENQPHRGEVAKMLVSRRARRRGIGDALMRAVEDLARERGKTLLTLDTASDGAMRLYERAGWTRVGSIPAFALLPAGRPCDTVIYYRQLA